MTALSGLWLSMLQAERRIRARTVWQGSEDGVGAYIRSTGILMVASGLLLALGYRLLGLDAPITLAVIAALLGLIPLLGWALAIVPAMLVGLIGGPGVAALAALVTLVVFLVLKLVVAPRLSDYRRSNPILTVLVMVALTDVLGILGLLLAIPLAAVIEIVLSELLARSAVAAASSQPATAPICTVCGKHGRRAGASTGHRWALVADPAQHGRAPDPIGRRSSTGSARQRIENTMFERILRRVLRQQAEQLVNRLLADEVKIVQHQDEVACELVQLVDQASGDHANFGEGDAGHGVHRSQLDHQSSPATRTPAPGRAFAFTYGSSIAQQSAIGEPILLDGHCKQPYVQHKRHVIVFVT